MPSITSIRDLGQIGALVQTPSPKKAADGFQQLLKDAIQRVDHAQQNSSGAIDKLLSGEDQELHKVALATQEAEIAFNLLLQVRNKVVSAYQEVMRMQM